MRFIALATDYDGTLASDGIVLAPTVAALERVRNSGRRLVLVTGRELPDLKRIFDRLDLFDRVVAENGALLYRPASREELNLGEPPPAEFVEALRRRHLPIQIGHSIIATVEPFQNEVLEVIREFGLELQIIFNKGAVMVLPSGVNKASGLHAALDDVGLSAHNVAGIGDAENDHAFLRLCGVAVAVANALPSIKSECDWVTDGAEGSGVAELIECLLGERLGGFARRNLSALAEDGSGKHIPLEPGSVLLAAGSSGAGKSTILTGLMERLVECRYQFCTIDPEGDFDQFAGAVILGTPTRPPKEEEIMDLLRQPRRNAIVNLVGLSPEDRAGFFARLLPELIELRTRTARPHWIILDEAHQLLPSGHDPVALALPKELAGVIMATVEPKAIAGAALSEVDQALLSGERIGATLAALCGAIGRRAPIMPGTVPSSGHALLWRSDGETRMVRLIEPKQAHKRHVRKYAEGNLPEQRSFYFRGPNGRLNLRARNLVSFLQLAEGVDDETWNHHLRVGDYSRWFRNCIKDEDLAREARQVESGDGGAGDSRARIREAILRRYTMPADSE